MVTRRLRQKLALGALATLLLFVVTRCALIAGLEQHYVVADAAAPRDAGGDAGDDADADTCMHAEPPPRPATDDGTGAIEVFLAMRTLDLGIADASAPHPPPGYDLDHVCSCPGPGSCKPRGDPMCSDDAGRDNSFGSVFAFYAQASNGTFNQATMNDFLELGLWSFIVRMRGYNGGANDTNVDVTVFMSNGIDRPADAGSDDAAQTKPRWDGNDQWSLDNATATADLGPWGDEHAYVADHVLVVNIRQPPRTPGPFPMRVVGKLLGANAPPGPTPMKIALSGMLVTGRLVPESGSYRLEEGIIAGRWATERLPELVNEFPEFAQDGGTICQGTPTYLQIRNLLCGSADLLADPAVSNPELPCNAASVAIAFTAFPATRGSNTTRTSLSSCSDAGIETCH